MNWQTTKDNANAQQLEGEIRAQMGQIPVMVGYTNPEQTNAIVMFGRELTPEEIASVEAVISAHVPDWSEREAVSALEQFNDYIEELLATWNDLSWDEIKPAVRGIFVSYLRSQGRNVQ